MPLPREYVGILIPVPVGNSDVKGRRGYDSGEYGVEEISSGVSRGGN